MNIVHKKMAAASLVALAIAGASPAFAAGTASGTNVQNTATVSYAVGGVSQPTVQGVDTFVVDRKVNLSLVEVGGTATAVSPGQTNAYTTFQLTNTSNATMDYNLAVAQPVGGAATFTGTDQFDGTNVRIYRDTNGDGILQIGTDTLVTYVDNLAADATATLFVVSDMPFNEADGTAADSGDVARVNLTATSRDPGAVGSLGTALTETTGANTAGVDTVFADTAVNALNTARDAAAVATDDFLVQTATLAITKTSLIISDPVNGTTNPKMIPGATIEYCVRVVNSGTVDATGVVVSDPLPAEVTFLTGTSKVSGTVTGATCNADGATGGVYTAGTRTIANTDAPMTVPAGTTRTLLLRATIN